MIRPTLIRAALAFAFLSGAATAQEVVQPLPGTTDADRLGEEMRRVGANPRDTDALLTAGELSLKLGDLSGAASLFARAEKVDPRSGRLKAGMAAILVRSERPGEALRYFAQAEALGFDPRRFAADRAFAFDLIGEQGRAQRDYRIALADGAADDETIRRYALSLGIAGRQGEALATLDPLLRRNDRGAWRARAFVLAMGGDVADAARIAQTMMPPGMASGLQPFFERLPTLPAADRAFAVHFGEVRATPERIADARLIPALAPFVPDRPAPVALASAQPAESGRDRRRREQRERRERRSGRVQVAAAAPPVLQPVPAPAGSSFGANDRASERVVLAARAPVPVARFPVPAGGTVALAGTSPPPVATAPGAQASGPASRASAYPPAQVAATTRAVGPPLTESVPQGDVRIASVARPMPVQVVPSSPGAAVAGPPATIAATTAAPTPVAAAGSASLQSGTQPPVEGIAAVALPPSQAAAEAAPGFASLAPAASAPPPAAPPASTIPRKAAPVRLADRAGADSILARIVAGLSIPASELGVGTPERRAAAPRPTAATGAGERVVQVADAKEARDVAARRTVGEATTAGRRGRGQERAGSAKPPADAEPSPPSTRAERLAARRLASADRQAGKVEPAAPPRTRAERAAARKAAADAALADARTADAKSTGRKGKDKPPASGKAADRAADKAARGAAPRIWVQVAGGANEDDLPKAWAGVKGKAADVLGKRQAYSTPLRATNRVLTGPFKTDAEARAFVNTLAKKGVSAFTFTSDAGQAVKPLPKGR